MASWEDGPEYAPALRPDHFAEPPVAPLPVAVPVAPSGPPPPLERPVFDHPQAPVAPLETLIPPVEDRRDPATPFDVASAAVTEASSAWGAAHWSRPGDPPPPTAPLGSGPIPGADPGPLALPAQAPAPFPAPGTTQWFQPAPPYPPPPAPVAGGPGVIAQTLTVGVIVTLVVGGVVWPLAPIAIGVAFGLASRVRVGRQPVLGVFAAVTAVLVVVGLVGALLSDGFFSDWWELLARWSQVLCWITLVIGWVVVWRALKTAPPGSGPAPTVWG